MAAAVQDLPRCRRCGLVIRKARPACPACGCEAPPLTPEEIETSRAVAAQERAQRETEAQAQREVEAQAQKETEAQAQATQAPPAAAETAAPAAEVPAEAQAPVVTEPAPAANKVEGSAPAEPAKAAPKAIRPVAAKAGMKLCPVCMKAIAEAEMLEHKGKKVCADCHAILLKKS